MGECQQTAFSNILQLIANITKMYHYDQSRNSRVKCDASHSGLGAALEQEIEKDVWVPIAFASRFLNDQEKKYSTNELELLAIVWSCEHFRTYLLGNHFVILTDHKAIISALKTNRGNKTYQSRLTRWADRLLPFDFDIFHISGCKLGIVDCYLVSQHLKHHDQAVLTNSMSSNALVDSLMRVNFWTVGPGITLHLKSYPIPRK